MIFGNICSFFLIIVITISTFEGNFEKETFSKNGVNSLCKYVFKHKTLRIKYILNINLLIF